MQDPEKSRSALLITDEKVEVLTLGTTYGMKVASAGQLIFCFRRMQNRPLRLAEKAGKAGKVYMHPLLVFDPIRPRPLEDIEKIISIGHSTMETAG